MMLAKKEVGSPAVRGKKVARTWDFVRRVVGDIVSVISKKFVSGEKMPAFIEGTQGW